MTENCGAHVPTQDHLPLLCARPLGHPVLFGSPHVGLHATIVADDMGLPAPTTVVHVRDMGPVPALGQMGAIYLGRPMPRHPDSRVQKGAKLRNRWRVGTDGDRPEVLERYLDWLLRSREGDHLRLGPMVDLRGRILACWCAPVGTIWTGHDPIMCHCQLVACVLDGLDPYERLKATWQ